MADWAGLGARPDAVGVLLREAAQRVRDRGWVQGRFKGEGGEVDAVQAIADVLGVDLTQANRREVRLAVGPSVLLGAALDRAVRAVGVAYLTHWNDVEGRTADEVVAALERAAG